MRVTGRPKFRGDNTEFYREIAARYVELGRTTRRIAPIIADETGVPVTTVHRWFREARRFGLLTVTWTELTPERACRECGRPLPLGRQVAS